MKFPTVPNLHKWATATLVIASFAQGASAATQETNAANDSFTQITASGNPDSVMANSNSQSGLLRGGGGMGGGGGGMGGGGGHPGGGGGGGFPGGGGHPGGGGGGFPGGGGHPGGGGGGFPGGGGHPGGGGGGFPGGGGHPGGGGGGFPGGGGHPGGGGGGFPGGGGRTGGGGSHPAPAPVPRQPSRTTPGGGGHKQPGPGGNAGKAPGKNPGTPTIPGRVPGGNPGKVPGKNPGQPGNPGRNPGKNPGGNPGQPGQPGQPGNPKNPGKQPGPGGHQPGNPGGNPGKNPGPNPGKNPGNPGNPGGHKTPGRPAPVPPHAGREGHRDGGVNPGRGPIHPDKPSRVVRHNIPSHMQRGPTARQIQNARRAVNTITRRDAGAIRSINKNSGEWRAAHRAGILQRSPIFRGYYRNAGYRDYYSHWYVDGFYGGFYYPVRDCDNIDTYFTYPMVYWLMDGSDDSGYWTKYYQNWGRTSKAPPQAYPVEVFPYAGIFYPTDTLRDLGIDVSTLSAEMQWHFRTAMNIFVQNLVQQLADEAGTAVQLGDNELVIDHYQNLNNHSLVIEGFVDHDGIQYAFKALINLDDPNKTSVFVPTSDEPANDPNAAALTSMNDQIKALGGDPTTADEEPTTSKSLLDETVEAPLL